MPYPTKLTADTPRRKKPPAPVRSEVVRRRKAGQGATEIGDALGISRARVYQHIYRARELGELPSEGAA